MLIAAARHAARRLSVPQQPARRRLAAQAVNLDAWLKEHGPTLKPPVANKLLFGGDLKVMVVGGPNQRRDYHLQEGEEFFAQLEGTLTLKTIERGSFKDVRVTGGDCFLLPSRVPHSPQREAASLGLVFERSHVEGEMDGMLWFDEGRDLSGRCDLDEIAYEAYFFCSDLGKDLKPVIEDYGRWKDAGAPPRRVAAPPLVPDDVVPLDVPQPLQPRLDGLQPSSTMLLHRGEEVIVEARVGVRCLRAAGIAIAFRHSYAIAAQAHAGPKKLATGGSPFEVFVWQRSGASRGVVDGEELTLTAGDCCLLPKATQYAWDLEDGVMLSVANAFT